MSIISKNKVEIKVDGENKTFWLGMGAIGLYLDNVKKDGIVLDNLIERLQENPFSVVPRLMYFCYAYGFVRQGKNVDITPYIVSEWIDENGGLSGTIFKEFIDAFTKSLSQGVPKEATETPKGQPIKKAKKPGKPK